VGGGGGGEGGGVWGAHGVGWRPGRGWGRFFGGGSPRKGTGCAKLTRQGEKKVGWILENGPVRLATGSNQQEKPSVGSTWRGWLELFFESWGLQTDNRVAAQTESVATKKGGPVTGGGTENGGSKIIFTQGNRGR